MPRGHDADSGGDAMLLEHRRVCDARAARRDVRDRAGRLAGPVISDPGTADPAEPLLGSLVVTTVHELRIRPAR